MSETSTRGDGPAMRSATDTFAPGRERGWNPTIPGRVGSTRVHLQRARTSVDPLRHPTSLCSACLANSSTVGQAIGRSNLRPERWICCLPRLLTRAKRSCWNGAQDMDCSAFSFTAPCSSRWRRERASRFKYTKIGAGWSTTEIPIMRQRPFSMPSAIVQPLRGAGPVVEPLGVTCARFFPDVLAEQREAFLYPQPLSKEFWESYAEPVADFLSGMNVLRELHQAVRLFQARSDEARRLRELQDALQPQHGAAQGLVAGVSMALQWNPNRQVQTKWVASSLLASLATMMLQDFAYGRALVCAGCGRPFVSGGYQARFCSERCRWTVQKRESRHPARKSNRTR